MSRMCAAGIAEVTIRLPRLALARANAAKTPVLDAARVTLSRCAMAAGCTVREANSLAEALSEAQCDAVIGIGGTGSGRRDDAVQELARVGRIEAHGIAICRARPQPSALSANAARCCSFPGRLDAALAVWLLIGRQLTAKLGGGSIEERSTPAFRRKVTSTIGIAELIPVRCSDGMVEPLGSGYLSLTALSRSDGWMVIPPDSEGFAAGSAVDINQWP